MNPREVFALRFTPVQRGQAFWIRSGELFNHYFGPIDVILQDTDGVHFGETGSQYRLRLRNKTSEALIVTLSQVDSESAPIDQ